MNVRCRNSRAFQGSESWEGGRKASRRSLHKPDESPERSVSATHLVLLKRDVSRPVSQSQQVSFLGARLLHTSHVSVAIFFSRILHFLDKNNLCPRQPSRRWRESFALTARSSFHLVLSQNNTDLRPTLLLDTQMNVPLQCTKGKSDAYFTHKVKSRDEMITWIYYTFITNGTHFTNTTE